MIRKAELEAAAEQAFQAIWYARSHHDDNVADAGRTQFENSYPVLALELAHARRAGDWGPYHRWCGRLATLRWMLADDGQPWDGAGRFDS